MSDEFLFILLFGLGLGWFIGRSAGVREYVSFAYLPLVIVMFVFAMNLGLTALAIGAFVIAAAIGYFTS
ncbi:hypothetical protein [Ktedonospora formicarum]|uniref:Uncharacterized protein n=1 Tax=Ktedonospora formicarum TaxID=2778364 RepID=A0A8J3I3L8_9CHLR|nr:hypothetical protein [Ktedonospora formicarum]GHO49547.1 hypothetical protein KSX_77100 [Ktedonospora formicarum]